MSCDPGKGQGTTEGVTQAPPTKATGGSIS